MEGRNMATKLMTDIIKWLEDYRDTTGCRGVVLGISGGKDSTTVAMLAKKVWGENVYGVMMPNGKQKDIKDSQRVCDSLGIEHTVINIENAYGHLTTIIPWHTKTGLSSQAATNIPPRIRMIILYAIAQTFGYRVIGTGNASEAYIGWTTKWGDSAYDLNPIGNLTCSEVISLGLELAQEFGLDESLIIKPPADGLTGMSDEENFGFTYDTLDSYIRGADIPMADKMAIDAMHRASAHKRELPPKFTF